MISRELKQRVEADVARYIRIANDTYKPRVPFDMPTISYQLKSGRKAGDAYTPEWRLRLNPIMFAENVDDFFARTIPHELAHLIREKVHYDATGKWPKGKGHAHGEPWKEVMRAFGVAEQYIGRCHTYKTDHIKKSLGGKYNKRKHVFTCACGKDIHYSNVIRRRVMIGAAYYTKCCKVRLTIPGAPLEMSKENVVKFASERLQRRRARIKRKGFSKFENAYSIVANAPSNATKAQIMQAIMHHCSMSYAGAQTYYYKAKGMLKKKAS